MSNILGLDLGTNSIGWAIVAHENRKTHLLEENGTPTKGVIIFPDGANIEAKTGSIKSRAAERTDYRGARRLKFRRKLRKYQTLLVLARYGLCPLSEKEVKTWRKSGFKKYPDKKEFLNWLRTDNFGEKDNQAHKEKRKKQNDNPYFFRDKFSRKKYDWGNNQTAAFELGRAFYHMAQRRGFKSNRLEQSDENVISEAKEQIQDAVDNAKNSIELHTIIQKMYGEYDLENKTKNDLDATQQKIRTILNYIRKVLSNKIKDKDYSNFDNAKAEIDRYINRPENLGKVKGGIRKLSEKIQKAGCETLGQYFWHLYKKDRHDPNNKIRGHYTAREEHYEHEFNVICKKQQLSEDIKTALYKAIFYQRLLKSQKGLVGKCTFEKNKPRCPVSRPDFEEFRMWSFINNIKIKIPSDDKLRPLTKEEKEKVIPRFYRQKATFKMEDIAKVLFGKEQVNNGKVAYTRDREAKNALYVINYKLNTTVSGNPVSAKLKNLLGKKYDQTYKVQTHQLAGKAEEIKIPVKYSEIAWHALLTFEDVQKLKEFAVQKQKLSLDETAAKKFSKITLPQGYANLSLKAINKILPWLKRGLIYSHAVFMANLDKVVDEEIWNNPDDREMIEKGIKTIIDTQKDESRKAIAVNSLLKKHQREQSYHPNENDLKDKLRKLYGVKTWKEKKENEAFFREACELLKDHITIINYRNEFVKIKRIDERIKDFLLGYNANGLVYCSDEERLQKNLYHPSDLETFKPQKARDKNGNAFVVNGKELEILPLPKTDAIKNPVLMRAMHQLRKLINELLIKGIIDDKTRIHIELSREINGKNRRKAWKDWQDNLRDKREDAIKESALKRGRSI